MREPTNDKRIGVSSLRVTMDRKVGSSCLDCNNGLLKADTAEVKTGRAIFKSGHGARKPASTKYPVLAGFGA
jgi:hypothetical protein